VELLPEVFPFEGDFGIVYDAVLLRLDRPERSHHPRVVVVRGDGGQHHVLGRRVRMSGEGVVRMGMADLRYERAGVAAVRVLRAEGGERRRREESGRRRRCRRRVRAVGGGGQQRAHAEVGLARQLQEGVVGHRALHLGIEGLLRGRVETHRGWRGGPSLSQTPALRGSAHHNTAALAHALTADIASEGGCDRRQP
jgi:hypothetical protein